MTEVPCAPKRTVADSFWMLASGFFYALVGFCAKMGAQDFSGFELVFYRNLIGALILGSVMLARGISFKTEHPAGHALRAGFAFLSMLFWMLCIPSLPLGTSQTLTNVAPLIVAAAALFGAVMKREKIPFAILAGIAAGFAGICLILRPDFSGAQIEGVVFALVSSAFAAGGFYAISALAAFNEPSERIVFYIFLLGLILASAAQMASGGFSPVTFEGALWLIGMGAAGALGQVTLTLAYARGNFLLSTAFDYSSIVFAFLIGVIVMGDSFGARDILGMALVIASGITSSLATRRK